MKKILFTTLALFVASAGLSGCMSTRAGQGAFFGGTAGAVVGGVATGRLGGAVAGGAIGALAGGVIGANTYRCQKVGIFGNTYTGTCWR